MKIACVIPAYNESERIGTVLKPVVESKLFDRVVVVDDGSEDKWELKSILDQYPNHVEDTLGCQLIRGRVSPWPGQSSIWVGR